jgi:hypothetical protein
MILEFLFFFLSLLISIYNKVILIITIDLIIYNKVLKQKKYGTSNENEDYRKIDTTLFGKNY